MFIITRYWTILKQLVANINNTNRVPISSWLTGKRRKTVRLKLTELRDSADRFRRIATQSGTSYKEARKKCENIKEQIKRRADEEVARIRDAENRLLKEIEGYETSVLGGGAPSEGESVMVYVVIKIIIILRVLFPAYTFGKRYT